MRKKDSVGVPGETVLPRKIYDVTDYGAVLTAGVY